MAFELQPFGEHEARLFSRLPLENRYMGFGAVGHVRAELQWYNLYHMWCPERKSLATPAFKRELYELLAALHSKKGVLFSSPALADFLEHAQSLAYGGNGFKIQTSGYSYFVRCQTAERCDYDITIYAYDNTFLLPELAGKHELPEKCYSVLPDSGTLVLLRRDIPHMIPIETEDAADDSPEARREVADDLNDEMGVTKAQEAAMLMGCLHGFGQPCAWPWQYGTNGEPRGQGKQQKSGPELP